MSVQESFFNRPRIALITNHGYGGVIVPVGGAPDTGGQNMYVNSMAQALVQLGFHVSIFARGGFPFFGLEKVREGIEPFGDNARYVYVPGGGDKFIRKEDIAVALDEEVDWIEDFVSKEAAELSCKPHQVYEIWNTHYWDAGVIGMLLEVRWMAREALGLLRKAVEGVALEETLRDFEMKGHWSGAATSLELLAGKCCLAAVDPTLKPVERVGGAVRLWCEKRNEPIGNHGKQAMEEFERNSKGLGPVTATLVEAETVGRKILSLWDKDGNRRKALAAVSRHVFTPHSLGLLKEENFKDRPLDVKRALKFCERRNHEIAVCNTARAFVATSTEIAERLRTGLGVDPGKMFFFPPGVDRKKFRKYSPGELAPVYDYLAEKSGVHVDELKKAKIIFETSRMDRTKRKDLLLDAFAMASEELDGTFLFIGGGPEKEIFKQLEDKIRKDSRLMGKAFLLGFIPDHYLYPMFSLADLFVTASEMEGFGMSAAQAAAVGTPLVTSHLVPFSAQYVPDAAVIVRAGDTKGFRDAIVRLLSDARDLEERGRTLAEKTAGLDWISLSRAFLGHLRMRGLEISGAKDEQGSSRNR
ncbi:MAG: glycosyltransferase family 1 protein [Deltaproteobacteria bacterium]|nr:glycosyltransferase family 1 protein [Deltaproteobacteria bacterium]